MRVTVAIVGTALAVSVAGCGDDTARTLRSVASWASASELLGRQWLAGHLPKRYAIQTLDRATEELKDKGDHGGATASAVDRLRGAIAREDAAAAHQALDQLSGTREVLTRRAMEARP
jgi:hypothetical protein